MGLWHTHGSPNLGQKIRPNNNNRERERGRERERENLQNCGLCCPGWAQNKTERMWKEEPRTCKRIWKKLWNMKVTIIPIVIGAFGTVTKGLLRDWRTWKLEDEGRLSKLQHWEQPEYWEESWRLEETCFHSNSNERPSANAVVKNSE